MRCFFLIILCLGLLFLIPGMHLMAFELEMAGGVNFLTFHPDRVTAHKVSTNFKKFQPYPMGFGSLNMKFNISETWAIGINAERDNIMFNSLDLRLLAGTDYFFFEFGPFAGMCDRPEMPDFGITGSIHFAFPGVIFAALNGTATIGSNLKFIDQNPRLSFTSNNSRESAGIRVGFWLPSIIPSVSFNLKQFTQKPDEVLVMRDTLYRFLAGIDIYTKTTPTVIKLEGGYQIFSRSYTRGNVYNVDELSSGFCGFNISVRLKSAWRFNFGAELPFAFKTVDPFTAPEFWRMPKATAGFAYLGL